MPRVRKLPPRLTVDLWNELVDDYPRKSPVSYVVYRENDTYYADACFKGGTDYSGADASTVIQAAIDALTHGIIFLKAGSYELTSPSLTLKSNITLQGEARKRNTYLFVKYGENFDTIVVPSGQVNVEIKNLDIRGARDYSTSGSGINITDSVVLIKNVRVSAMVDYGLYMTGACSGSYIIDSSFSDNGKANMYFYTVSDTFISRVFAGGGPGDCIEIRYGGNLRFTDVSAYLSSDGDGIHALYTNDVIFTNCHVGNNKLDGLAFGGSGTRGNNNKVIGGTYYNNGRWGIVVGETATNRDTLIIGATIRNNDQDQTSRDGIAIFSALRTKVIGCSIYDDQATPTQDYGIDEDTIATDTIITNNHLFGNTEGQIRVLGTNPWVYRNKGFITENSGTGTIPAGATSIDVSHNLDVTPDINKIDLTPKDNLAGRTLWIEAHPTAPETYFVIKMDNEDAVDHVFAWSYGE